MQNTTPSGCACHPSIGGELLSADAMQSLQCICTRHLPSAGGELMVQSGWVFADTMPPPRQASLATPPQEGNCLPLRFGELGGAGRLKFCRYAMFWVEYALCQHIILCKYPASGSHDLMVQSGWDLANARHHPVKRSLTPLHRRGMVCPCGMEYFLSRCETPPRQASPPRTDAR